MTHLTKTIQIQGHHPLLHTTLHYAVEAAIALMDEGISHTGPNAYDEMTDRVVGHLIDIPNLYDTCDERIPEREAAQWFWSEMNPSVLYDLLVDGRYTADDLIVDTRDRYILTLTVVNNK